MSLPGGELALASQWRKRLRHCDGRDLPQKLRGIQHHPERHSIGTEVPHGEFHPNAAPMTFPRQIIPGRYWLLTRRCSGRKFFLHPDSDTHGAFTYCLAEAVSRTDIEVMGYVAMSNHYHAVVRDPKGHLPKFLEHLNKFTARVLNKKLKRKGLYWEAEPANAAHLVLASDVMRKLVYTLVNPVAAHLVERVEDWPGACSYSASLSGETIEAERPRFYFRQKGKMPERISLKLTRPPGFAHLTEEGWARHLESEITREEERFREERLRQGRTVLGRAAVLAASPLDEPKTPEIPEQLHPEVACKNRIVRNRALQALKAFRRAHEAARLRIVAKELDTIFPYGTYKMRLTGLNCAGPPTATE